MHYFLLMKVDECPEDLLCILAYFLLWQVIVLLTLEHEQVGIFIVLHYLTFLSIVHNQIDFVFSVIINNFIEATNIRMVEHLVNVYLTHCIDVGRPISLSHHTSSQLLHN